MYKTEALARLVCDSWKSRFSEHSTDFANITTYKSKIEGEKSLPLHEIITEIKLSKPLP